MTTAHFHLPGLFEFVDFYTVFLEVFSAHREFFYDWCDIASIYGAPGDALWGGGRAGFGDTDPGTEKKILALASRHGFSVRLAFSNSLLRTEHLSDRKCNRLAEIFHDSKNGIILHSDLLLEYMKRNFPDYYFVSSTTKVIEEFSGLEEELSRDEFSFVVPDFRLNKEFLSFGRLPQSYKDKVEFLCNECCWTKCRLRKKCYENVSRRVLGEDCPDWECTSPSSGEGYLFSKAMQSPAFISLRDIRDRYLPAGFSNFKIEGRSLGSAMILEFLLYYMTKPEYQIHVREKIYLSNTLDLF